MRFLKRNLDKLFLVSFTFLMPIVVFAADDISGEPCDTSGKLCNPIPDVTSIPGLIEKILTNVLKIGIPVIALAIIYCGFLFVSARGKPEAITKARDALLYTLIGAAILLGSWAIATVLVNTMGAL